MISSFSSCLESQKPNPGFSRGVRYTDPVGGFGLVYMMNVIDCCKKQNDFLFERSSWT